MDLAYLTAVTKTTHFPPHDPWFAGGQMNYYYLGFVLVAVLVKLTSIVPYIAYNLAVPTLFAFVGAAAFTVVLGLVGGDGRRRRRPGVLGAALLGMLFVAVVGNLGEIRVLADRIEGAVPNDWWFWNASRLIHHPPGEPGPINEFPAFTYLFADLHAHAMALPYTVLLLALLVAFLRRGREQEATAGAVCAVPAPRPRPRCALAAEHLGCPDLRIPRAARTRSVLVCCSPPGASIRCSHACPSLRIAAAARLRVVLAVSSPLLRSVLGRRALAREPNSAQRLPDDPRAVSLRDRHRGARRPRRGRPTSGPSPAPTGPRSGAGTGSVDFASCTGPSSGALPRTGSGWSCRRRSACRPSCSSRSATTSRRWQWCSRA